MYTYMCTHKIRVSHVWAYACACMWLNQRSIYMHECMHTYMHEIHVTYALYLFSNVYRIQTSQSKQFAFRMRKDTKAKAPESAFSEPFSRQKCTWKSDRCFFHPCVHAFIIYMCACVCMYNICVYVCVCVWIQAYMHVCTWRHEYLHKSSSLEGSPLYARSIFSMARKGLLITPHLMPLMSSGELKASSHLV
jgi:hypothetical protein